MYTVAIRGATTIDADTKEEVIQRTRDLVSEMVSSNSLNNADRRCVSVIVSTTSDIHSYYPVRAIRESGLLSGAPLFSCLEPDINGALPLCIRVMITANFADSGDKNIRHVYQRGAASLRPDLATKPKLNKTVNIAIDGPAGAGKSTIAKRLAGALGFLYLDTGAMYRAVALKMLACGVPLDDEAAVGAVLKETVIDVRHENGAQRIFLDGSDVSDDIRRHEVSKAASDVSALPCVRLKMVELQRDIASRTNTILDGRDIGTYVLPNAEVKFFLTATVDERARRRYGELIAKGTDCTYETIRKDIEIRDYNDSHRLFAPLKKADDAIEVNTTDMTIEEVARHMTEIISEKCKA